MSCSVHHFTYLYICTRKPSRKTKIPKIIGMIIGTITENTAVLQVQILADPLFF